MRSTAIAPSAPYDTDIYLVLDNFGGRLGQAWRETPEERTERETVLIDLLDGQFTNPSRIVVFNTAAGVSSGVFASSPI
jgi:hypothetical protein